MSDDRCKTEGECTMQPWCRINGECHRASGSPPAAASAVPQAAYRLLTAQDIIQSGDELLADDTVRWLPLVGWEIGRPWHSELVPVRRAVQQAEPTGAPHEK